jgi:hypothetical protein
MEGGIMRNSPVLQVVLAFLAAVLFATVWGAIVQTQFNLAALNSIGADIGLMLNLRTTLADIFSGFSLTYAGYFVLPAFLVAFAAAWWVSRQIGTAPQLWFALAGGLAILLAIPLVNYLSPLALLIGATRDWLCTALMALGGVGAGLIFFGLLQRPYFSRPRPVIDTRVTVAR